VSPEGRIAVNMLVVRLAEVNFPRDLRLQGRRDR
jgi:hypothetical protein